MTREERIKTLSSLINNLENLSQNYKVSYTGYCLVLAAEHHLSSLMLLEKENCLGTINKSLTDD